MDIEQVRSLHRALELEIADLLRKFEHATEMNVEDVQIIRLEPLGFSATVHNVKVRVEL